MTKKRKQKKKIEEIASGTKQDGTRQHGTKQPGTKQDRTKQDGTSRDGTKQDGTKQPGTKQDGTKQDGTRRDGTNQAGTIQVGTREDGTKQDVTKQAGTKRDGTKQDSNEVDVPVPTGNTVLDRDIKPELIARWPKLKLKVPPIFLHNPVYFEQHVIQVLNKGIKLYQPLLGINYTKITCETLKDHNHLIKYLEKKQVPFHTYGNPTKRKLKVVIRGIPKETDLNKVKAALKSVSIPIIRVHKMHTKEERKDNTMLVLAVVPYDEGKVILKLVQVLGHNVKLEPPVSKPRQCYRCQKWGHSQRYCHGQIKCVKCGRDHLSKKCDRIPEEEPPKCANCSADHTASYRKCMFAPGSEDYQRMQDIKTRIPVCKPLQLVTMENCYNLYKNEYEDEDD